MVLKHSVEIWRETGGGNGMDWGAQKWMHHRRHENFHYFPTLWKFGSTPISPPKSMVEAS